MKDARRILPASSGQFSSATLLTAVEAIHTTCSQYFVQPIDHEAVALKSLPFKLSLCREKSDSQLSPQTSSSWNPLSFDGTALLQLYKINPIASVLLPASTPWLTPMDAWNSYQSFGFLSSDRLDSRYHHLRTWRN